MKPTGIWAIVLVLILIGAAWWYLRHSAAPAPTQSVEVNQDSPVAVSENILGTWQSTQDPKFTREFKSDGTSVDSYDGKVQSTDTWKVFSKDQPLGVSFPLEANTAYVQIEATGDPSNTLNFKIATLTPDELDLVYLDRGGILVFKKVK